MQKSLGCSRLCQLMYVAAVEDSAHGGKVASKELMLQKVSIQMRAPDGAPLESPLEVGDELWQLHEPVTAIDPRDMPTPDDWIPRHPVRLQAKYHNTCTSHDLIDLLLTEFTPTILSF